MKKPVKWIKWTLMAAIVVFAYVDPETARAQVVLSPPWDASSFAYIGRHGTTNQQVIVWDNMSTPGNECAITVIGGTSGLYGNTLVRGSRFKDQIGLVVSQALTCGNSVRINPLVYNGFYLDIDGREGDDFLTTGDGDTFLYGYKGDDTLITNGNSMLLGGAGSDILSAQSFDLHGESLYGQEGSDCLQDANAAASVFDCGSSPILTFDFSATGQTPINVAGCELRKSFCF